MYQVIRLMGEAYKVNLARLANLSNTAVGATVSSLHGKPLLTISSKRNEGRHGQPTTLYQLESKGFSITGVRVDRNCIQKFLIDFEGAVLSRLSHESILAKNRNSYKWNRGAPGRAHSLDAPHLSC